MSIGKTQEWLDHAAHVDEWYDRVNAYADHMIHRDILRGPEIRYQDEKAPDGRSIYLDNQGYYRATREELGK